MPLARGQTLGPYEVVAPLGAGGMGEVYRARDTRLGRDVALKVLPEDLAADPERLRRFELEARAASALSHPNVVAVYDVGREGSVSYVVMELVEGKSLRESMNGSPVAAKRLLGLAVQIADGLAAAHARGIVHRDLKPENVMVGADGVVKILDFGLAKLTPLAASEDEKTATIAAPRTGAGVILGTIGYMSPEQAAGAAVDFRSDQFSLGSILYEMAVGRRAFSGATPIDTLSAILHAEPEALAVASPLAPVPLRWTIERCLSKEPDGRFASTRDLAAELRTIRDHLSDAVSAAPAARPPRSRRLATTAALLLAAAAALAAAYLAGRRAGAPPPLSFHRLTMRRGYIFSARLTPDERSVVYGGAWDGKPFEVFSTPIASPGSNALGLVNADVLAVSRSGELALSLRRQHQRSPYSSLGTLARVPMSGGAPRELLEAVLHADWSPDGTELAVARALGGTMRLEYPIGTLLAQNDWLGYPRVSPDGTRVAFFEHALGEGGVLAVVDRASRKTILARELGSERSGLAWSPDGRSIWFAYAETGKNLALERVTLSGKRTRVTNLPASGFLHDVTTDGRVLVSLGDLRFGIVWQRPGMLETDASWLETSKGAGIAADGSAILFAEDSSFGGSGVYLRKADLSPAVRLGDGAPIDLSPGGTWALARMRGRTTELFALPTGIGVPRRLATSGLPYGVAGWLDDGARIVFSAVDSGKTSLFVQSFDGPPRVFAKDVGGGTFCTGPDRRSVLFVGSDGAARLYPVDGGEPRELFGTVAGDRPITYSDNGRSVYVSRSRGFPYRVEAIDVASGTRSLWREIVPPDLAGLAYLGFGMTPDARSWAYSYGRHLSTLYLIDGLR